MDKIKKITFGWNEDCVNPVSICKIVTNDGKEVTLTGGEADELYDIIEEAIGDGMK